MGESGCGKSSLGLTLLRLLPRNGEVVGGSVRLGDQELLEMSDEAFRQQIRWSKISMVFQGAMNALNPVLTVGSQITEAILAHEPISKDEATRVRNSCWKWSASTRTATTTTRTSSAAA